MLKGKTFAGANVFMSRKLVPPEVFDSLLDALKLNGAEVFLCCDSSRNGPNDFHVISSPAHEKFDDLREKGCHLLGPQCVLSCAKERRMLPRKGFVCCLAMDGAKVLVSGFDMDEKVKIEKMVIGMGGELLTRVSSDINFVVVKNVLAAKYKFLSHTISPLGVNFAIMWDFVGRYIEQSYNLQGQWALNTLKKPIVTIDWLHQCWNEHHVVPQEPYRVLPFSGLTISVTKIDLDDRKKIGKGVLQNGGKYSPELTKMCTHLIADNGVYFSASVLLYMPFYQLEIETCVKTVGKVLRGKAPEGDKYKVARRWGHIHIVARKWFEHSVARRACLTEESYPVQSFPLSSSKTVKSSSSTQLPQDKCNGFQTPTSSLNTHLNGHPDSDLEATLSQNMTSMFSDASAFSKDVNEEVPKVQATNEPNLDCCVASDSQSEDSDEYLSECVIALVGFETSEMRKLVNMVRKGGGSRRSLSNDKFTHIVIGAPSEFEKKELRSLAASGVINVVKSKWLEDCDREKKEVQVLRHHAAYELLIPKDSVSLTKGAAGLAGIIHGKAFGVATLINSDNPMESTSAGIGMKLSAKNLETKTDKNTSRSFTPENSARSLQQDLSPVVNDEKKDERKANHSFIYQNAGSMKLSTVFKGRTFRFSESFPEDRRSEIVEWISQGGGRVAGHRSREFVQFTIECHGVVPKFTRDIQTTYVSSHWVRSCLEDGNLLDVSSHVIYSPLPCEVPLPGFENLRFCISQYEEKDRSLLRNLCFVLGTKLVEKLTKKVTHLLCKFSNGPKYQAACKWGIRSITCEWIYECIRQNKIVAVDLFSPKEVTSQDQEAGFCTVSQFPTQAARMVTGENSSDLTGQSQECKNTRKETRCSKLNSSREDTQQPHKEPKKARLMESEDQIQLCYSEVYMNDPISNSGGGNNLKYNGESLRGGNDVAASIEVIEGLYELAHDNTSVGRTACEKNLFPPECSVVGEDRGGSVDEDHRGSHPVIELSKLWPNRPGKQDDLSNLSKDANEEGNFNFSETQTDSQVVGYEEDLSGRQMLIDRVRMRTSLT